MSALTRVVYYAPGPVALAFYSDFRIVVAIQGPIGSAKTSTALMKQIRLAQLQQRSPRDGIRRYRVAVVRDTYRQLWRSTIPSWFDFIPKGAGEWTGGEDQPATHRLKLAHPGDGGPIDFEILFLAIGEHKVEEVLRGFQVTRWYLNEADLLAPEVLTYCLGRLGRYPRMDDGGPVHDGIDLDFNAPDIDTYIYEKFLEERPAGWGYHNQPGGVIQVDGRWVVNPDAENLKNLRPGYYERQLEGAEEWYIRRMLANLPGFSRHGKPVYPEYNDALHCAQAELVPVRGVPLTFGFDAGGSPAGIIRQHLPTGQRRWYDEIIAGQDGYCGPERFSEEVNRVLALPKYKGIPIGYGYADPSAQFGADKEAGESNWIEIVAAKTAIRILPAPTNELTPRQDAVRIPLTRLIDGRTPGLLISPTMKFTRRGFVSDYRYRKMATIAGRAYAPTPEKNEASHPHDAGQYAELGGGGYHEVMGRKDAADSAVLHQAQQVDGAGGGLAPPRRRRDRLQARQAD